MDFLIADTFTDSLARLTNDEQKLVKTTAFDLQLNPANPGMQFHKLDRAKDKNFWSVRVGRDIRLIVHKTAGNLLLCYAGHHDDAYNWAERRKIERHPRTGAAQLVEVRERVQEVVVPKYVEPIPQAARPAPPKPALFATVRDDDLLGYGVPPEWLADVKKATEDSLLELADHLPREAAEALLDLATGAKPRVAVPVPADQDPFQHPDARQRFRVMTNVEELERALDAPWEKWSVFLHPAQQDLVERRFNGPARVAGSAGTGKTVVALHRTVFLARANPTAKVLVTTFSDPLANMLRAKLHVLIGNEPAVQQRIAVHAINTLGMSLYSAAFGQPKVAAEDVVRGFLHEAARVTGGKQYSDQFLWNEWDEVVDAWQLRTWDDYRTVGRLGRKTRLGEAQRKALWQIFERVQRDLAVRGLVTLPAVFARLTEHFAQGAACHSTLRWSTKRRTSASPSSVFWRLWLALSRTACSSRAISDRASSSRRSRGSRSESMCVVAHTRSGSTTARRTRSGGRPTDCFRRPSRTLTVTPMSAAAPCLCSTAPIRASPSPRTTRLKSNRSLIGCATDEERACSRMRSAYSFGPTRNCGVPSAPSTWRECSTFGSTNRSRCSRGKCPLALCMLPRGWSFGRS